MFESANDVQVQLRNHGYVCQRNIGTIVYLASRLEKPILVEGPAGVGKTDLARTVARAMQRDLIRLQCYEGLDEAKALYEWEYSKQLLYTQILKEKLAETMAGASTLREAADRVEAEEAVFFSSRFIVPRPLLKAITSEAPCLLLIDEVDKSDPEFEAFLLEVLSDYQISIPEIGTIDAQQRPVVFLTSNDAREMSDALKRRCLHLYINFPNYDQELEILEAKIPGISHKLAEQVVSTVQGIRKLDLKKTPSISETLDWARALVSLNTSILDKDMAEETLNVILKYESDIQKVKLDMDKVLQRDSCPAKEDTDKTKNKSKKQGALH